MADRLIIDTYNVLHVTGVLPPDLAGLDRVQLARLIGRSRWAGADALLVCDGRPGATPLPSDLASGSRIRLAYAGPGPDAADIYIERLINADSAPRTLTVVSSDRRILAAARRRRSRSHTSESFLNTLATDAAARSDPGARDRPLDARSTSAWLREFGYDPAGPDAAPNLPETLPDPLDPEWQDLGITEDDLDMRRWVKGVEPDERDEP